MPTINWTAVAVIVAIIIPLVNSWFQHWLKTRSKKKAVKTAPAVSQPNTKTQVGTAPLGIIAFLRREMWFMLLQVVINMPASVILFAQYNNPAPVSRRTVVFIALVTGSWAYLHLILLRLRDSISN